MSYAEYKFGKAMRALAMAPGSEREWIASSHVFHICRLQGDELPREIRVAFSCLKDELARLQTRYGARTLQAVAEAMTEDEVNRFTDWMVSLYEAMPCARHQAVAA